LRDRPETLAPWTEFLDGEHRDWDRLFAGYRAQVDFPGAAYWRELAAHYPEAKVILTVRDPEKWHASVVASVMELTAERDKITNPHHRAVLDFGGELVGGRYFEGRPDDKDYIIGRFKQHIDNVKAEIPPERLLVYSVTEGWGPLCAFLGAPEPEAPFPHANDRDSYRDDWDDA